MVSKGPALLQMLCAAVVLLSQAVPLPSYSYDEPGARSPAVALVSKRSAPDRVDHDLPADLSYSVYFPLLASAPTATFTRIPTATLTPTTKPTLTSTPTATLTPISTLASTATATLSPTPTASTAPGCPTIPSENYNTLSVNPPPTDRPAEVHPDLNLSIRGYITTTGTLGLVDYTGASDSRAPQLPGLFVDNRTPNFVGVYQVYDWDWSTNSRGAPISDPPVTLAALRVTPGERIQVPGSGYNIGTATLIPPPGTAFLNTGLGPAGYQVLVLYAAPNRITLKYTRDDNVVKGYTLHVEQVCVEPRLLALYNQMNSAGRAQLPALNAGQAFGTAIVQGIGVSIRDTGSFMDPRSRKDWWQGR